MANKPTFSHPPLEVGVPKYPTPVVPDFYTKSGHIILVVKESVEKGSYNPKPLDGSITYNGIDANKFPAPLYLVYQAPTADGEYVFNTYANDRTLASQDPWNYGISYQDENPNYPIYTRTYTVPRSQYAPVALNTTDPVFGGTAIITKQAMAEFPEDNPLASRYVQVQRIYETVPGPSTAGYQFDDFIESNLLISKQIVAANSTPLTESGYHTSTGNYLLSFKDEPIDSTKSQRVIVATPSLPPTRTEYKTGTYTSPLLVFGMTVAAVNLSCDGGNSDVRIKITPITRSSQSRQTTFKTITSYSYGAPSTPGDTNIFSPVLKEVAYTGYVINFNLGGALCDEIKSNFAYDTWDGHQIVTTNVTQIPVHYCNGLPNAFESWDISATDTSATQYSNLIGSYQKISWESRYWKAGIWENKEVWVKLI